MEKENKESFVFCSSEYSESYKDIKRILNSSRVNSFSDEYLAWRYLGENSPMPPMVIFVSNALNERIGMISVIFRSYYVNGEKCFFAIRGDAAIKKIYRKRGLGKSLYYRLKNELKSEDCVCSMGLPNANAIAVAKHAGFKNEGGIVTLVYPYNITKKIEEKNIFMFPSKTAGKAICLYHKLKLGLKQPRRMRYEISNRVDSSFQDLWEDLPKENCILRDRSKDVLEWRYVKHPLHKFQFFKVIQEQALVGYIIMQKKEGSQNIKIYDFIVMKKDLVRPSMYLFLNTMIKKHKKVRTIRMFINENHPYYRIFLSMGFFKREKESEIITHFYPDNDFLKKNIDWYITLGDKDI